MISNYVLIGALVVFIVSIYLLFTVCLLIAGKRRESEYNLIVKGK